MYICCVRKVSPSKHQIIVMTQGLLCSDVFILSLNSFPVINFKILQMKEILMINVGQAGVRVGDKTWQILLKQHNLNKTGQQIQDNGIYNNQTMFDETPHHRFVPRNIYVDTDPDSINEIKLGQRRDIYKSSYYISGKQDSANNYIRGRFVIGKHIIDQTLDQIRKILERCSHLEGVIINHAISGGTGSGFVNLLLDRLECQTILNKKAVISNLITPSPNISDTIVEPYNVNLALGDLNKERCSKIINCFDNQKMYRKCEQNGIDNPGYNQINQLIAHSISILTEPYRLKSISHSMVEIHSNMVPYNKLCFLSPKIHTQTLVNHQSSRSFIEKMWNEKNCLSSYREHTDKNVEFSMSTFFRGNVSKSDVYQSFQHYKQNTTWIDWCKTGLKLFGNEFEATPGENFVEGLTLTNNNNMSGLLHMWNSKYDKLFQRRMFVHWYVGEGIQDQDFAWSRHSTAELEQDYQEASVFHIIDQ